MSKIITFDSVIHQEEDILNVEELYKDIENQIQKEKTDFGLEKLDRGHPLQHVMNSTSAGYLAPTAMKSFMQCPAGYLFNKLVPEEKGSATSVGTTFHNIMEEFYNSPNEERTKEAILQIANRKITEDQNEDSSDIINKYIDGYFVALDYENNKTMDHKKLDCACEVFLKPNIQPLGIDLGVPIYIKIDRIDVRDSGIYVIDYKTGFGDPNPYLLGENGYLPQMIFYKWAVEAEYGQEINKAFLCLPGATTLNCKYTEMNVNSLVEQSKVIEECFKYLEYAKDIRSKLKFPSKTMRYCNSCQMKNTCYTYIKSKNLDESNIKEDIPVHIEYDANLFNNIEESKN